jgi:hypothetical protein
MSKEQRKLAFLARQRATEAERQSKPGYIAPYTPKKVKRAKPEAKPVPGSQEWAETYRDNIGETFD